MSLLYLDKDDFKVVKSEGKVNLHTTVKNISMVLFYTNSCPYCKHILKIFKSMPRKITELQFGIVNLSRNKNVVEMSRTTSTPMNYVPYIVVYVRGKPIMIYNGNLNESGIKEFISTHIDLLNEKLVENQVKRHPCTLGIPIYGDDDSRCFLPINEAYI